jgi:small-conductance mechanosensitive channel
MMGTRRTGGPVQPVVMFFLRFTLYLGALAVFYTGVLGRDILAILATTSVVLTVVGLALRELIFDAVAGIAIAADNDLKVGVWMNMRARDRSLTGVIDHLGWRALCIRSRDGVLHYVPNSIVATQALSNLLPATGSTRLEIPFIMDARADVTTILPRLTKAVDDEIAELEGVDADKSMRVVIESLENDKIRCVVQVYYSLAFSTDTLRTKVLDRIRRELIASKALSSSRTVMPAQSASPFIAQVYRS